MVSEQQHGKWSQNAGALAVVQQVEGVANHFGQVCQVLVPDGVFQAVVEREFFDSRHKLLQQLVLDDGSGGLRCAFVSAHVVVHVRGNLKEVLRLLENDASIFWHLLLLVASTTVLDAPRCLKSKASFGGAAQHQHAKVAYGGSQQKTLEPEQKVAYGGSQERDLIHLFLTIFVLLVVRRHGLTNSL